MIELSPLINLKIKSIFNSIGFIQLIFGNIHMTILSRHQICIYCQYF